ncbi:hypothetical protein T4B_15149 [Trichinella pseudospiralis]|uniref:Uncharacterized protein n=1 Tax=Trichinella pseudospiralis TaxID=6337 RepID=A0A0V1IQ01_TRIPS|nr:hypothetical protein T4C_6609 [Trichinella pseudospiralis]KRZ24866.1 hypothetical protein T4C_5571 [Trichinella pseudospiralis]KRZ29821.1 hypothetical protein T4B_15149 [Trichinella pseudospiralis]
MVDKVAPLVVGSVCLNATGTAWFWVWLSTKQIFCCLLAFSLCFVENGRAKAEPEANNQILIFRQACCRLFSMTRLCCLTGRLRGLLEANRAKFKWDNGQSQQQQQ